MGIFSWFRSRRSAAVLDEEGPPSLLYRNQEDDPELDEIRRAAAADVARVEQDDKYFRSDSPANQDEL